MDKIRNAFFSMMPVIFVAAACWMIPFENRLYLFIAIIVSLVVLLLPVVTNIYQILAMGTGLYFAIAGAQNIVIIILYGLLFLMCCTVNIVFLSHYFKYMRDQKNAPPQADSADKKAE